MTLPGLEDQTASAGRWRHPLERAAAAHVERLRAAGLLTAAHELQAELVLHLARQVAGAKPYSLAQLSKELREALLELPTAAAGDAWDDLLAAIRGEADE